ncbi:hypothetical protein SAMN05216223_1195 [Actinacidiphila yanglinensis]|uniref:Uncharacterized protein n=1 Tax=Actinacidiphila yanglinensis TaxID=310779 RepID=A0A1H6DSF9_9ACTN|nr:hypothetical protein [Actinacidiphila yanglinensis]SEG88160.1 hypothetical protein SAMN05216223_1195 [Actinacidiphila yanglinensis]
MAVASATLGPWRPAAVVGALGGGVSLALHLVGGHFGLGILSSALSVAALLFFCVGGAGAVLGYSSRGAGRDRRIRRWARSHPWQVATVPAGMMFLTDLVVRQALTSQGFFGSVWTGLWHGAVVAAVVGVAGTFSRSRA